MNHPKDRSERRRSAQAKALGTNLYRQRKINAKKRHILVTLEDQEAQNELEGYNDDSLPG